MVSKTESVTSGVTRGFFSTPLPYIAAAAIIIYLYRDKIANFFTGGLSGAAKGIQDALGNLGQAFNIMIGGTTYSPSNPPPQPITISPTILTPQGTMGVYVIPETVLLPSGMTMSETPPMFIPSPELEQDYRNAIAKQKTLRDELLAFEQSLTPQQRYELLNAPNYSELVQLYFQGRVPITDFRTLFSMNLAMDIPTKEGRSPLARMMELMLVTTQRMFTGGALGQQEFIENLQGQGGMFTVTSKTPLIDILRENPNLTASQAANLKAMIMPDPQYLAFNFGTNTGSALKILEAYNQYRGLA